MVRTRRAVRAHLVFDPATKPATRRVVDAVVRGIENGSLIDDDLLPSSRALSDDTGIARSVVVEAYETLCGIGVLTAAQGSGTKVSPGARDLLAERGPADPPTRPRRDKCRGRVVNLTVPGGADDSVINLRDWHRAWREAVDPECREPGTQLLQRVLVDHLRSFRGVVLQPERLVLRPSLGSAIADIVHGLDMRGRGVAVEDPGYPRIQRHLVNAGCRVHCAPVDDEGLRVDLLNPDDAAVHVTPARQWPTGFAMSLRRREQLLAWARQTGGVIIENDQDAEFTYGHAPLPTLYSMAEPGSVVYLGSSSKLLTAELHVVWMVVPNGFRRRSDDLAPVSDYATRALANFIASGALYRHRNRALHLYQERREALVRSLALRTPLVRVEGEPSGTEVLLSLPPGCDEIAIQMRLEDVGFQVSTLGDFAMRHHPPALLLQYGELTPVMATCFAEVLCEVLGEYSADVTSLAR